VGGVLSRGAMGGTLPAGLDILEHCSILEPRSIEHRSTMP
jgi:hypothetical protein